MLVGSHAVPIVLIYICIIQGYETDNEDKFTFDCYFAPQVKKKKKHLAFLI